MKDAKEGASATDAGREFQLEIVREFEAVSSCRNLSQLQRVIGSGSGVACRAVLVRENVNQIVVDLKEHCQLAFGPSGLQCFPL